MRTAVIGGGLAGLACARALAARGTEVVLYDRGKNVGGRMCAKRLSTGHHADAGARGFGARDERFVAEVESWVNTGHAAVWDPRLVSIEQPGALREIRAKSTRYVGVPAMHAPLRAMADALANAEPDPVEIRTGTHVKQIHRSTRRGTWTVTTAEGSADEFDAVALATPSNAAAELLAEIPHLRARAAGVPMGPCWATVARFDDRLPLGFDAANVLVGGRHPHSGVLAWIDRESSKPGRPDDEVWVLHATEEWSRDHVDADRAEIAGEMIGAFFSALDLDPVAPVECLAHRWKSGFPVAPLCDGCLFDEGLSIGACGDWCMGARVESAYLSGLAMAARLLGERADFLAPSMAGHREA